MTVTNTWNDFNAVKILLFRCVSSLGSNIYIIKITNFIYRTRKSFAPAQSAIKILAFIQQKF